MSQYIYIYISKCVSWHPHYLATAISNCSWQLAAPWRLFLRLFLRPMRRLAELMGWTGWVPSREILGLWESAGKATIKKGSISEGDWGENDFSLDGDGNIEGFGTQDLGILKSSG